MHQYKFLQAYANDHCDIHYSLNNHLFFFISDDELMDEVHPQKMTAAGEGEHPQKEDAGEATESEKKEAEKKGEQY